MKRILIIGGPGAGKSALAAELARHTGLPLRNLDKICRDAEGRLLSPSECDRRTRAIHDEDAWILAGEYHRTVGEAVIRSEVVIWLDMPFWLRLWRVLSRGRVGGPALPAVPGGAAGSGLGNAGKAPASVDLAGMIRDRAAMRERNAKMMVDHAQGRHVIWLTKPAAVKSFLAMFADQARGLPSKADRATAAEAAGHGD